ncbi:MAG: hypothetical protein MMC23_009824 [Stictis urceolatum]|nr:hypothetical protein [Stictis urceolata]
MACQKAENKVVRLERWIKELRRLYHSKDNYLQDTAKTYYDMLCELVLLTLEGDAVDLIGPDVTMVDYDSKKFT